MSEIIPRNSKFFNYIDTLLKSEGGNNDSILSWDRGGKTNHGVTWKNWINHLKRYSGHSVYLSERWQKYHSFDGEGLPYFDTSKFKYKYFRVLEANDVKFFYFKDYWELIKADDMPFAIDYYMFDFTVHSGQGNSVKVLQDIVNVIQDGSVGNKTLNAIEHYIQMNGQCEIEQGYDENGKMTLLKGVDRKKGIKALLTELNIQRRNFLKKSYVWVHASKGMNNRLNYLMSQCYNILGGMVIDNRKPLSQSRTLKASVNSAKIGAGLAVVGGLAPTQENAINTIPNIVENLQTVNTISSLVSNLYSYGWIIPIIVLIGFAGYYYYIRKDDWFMGK